jgi:hypothetical protein
MIHHISIAANHPLQVAQVLAELLQGQAMPFPEHDGGFIALNFDEHGTLIEILPDYLELKPGIDDAPGQWETSQHFNPYSAVHAAISVPVSEAEIRAIADREGWRMMRCDRGDDFFAVIELWIENRQLIELLPPELAARYLAFMQPNHLKQLFA